MAHPLFAVDVDLDWQGFVDCITRAREPRRVHIIELFLDREVRAAIAERYNLWDNIDPNDPVVIVKRDAAVQRFLGYDYVRCPLDDFVFPVTYHAAPDTAPLAREGGRSFVELRRGPVATWEDFERYPWPDPSTASTRSLEWCEANLPEDMCIVAGGGFAHFAEFLSWLMGYETLCLSLYDQRDLVEAISRRLIDIFEAALKRILAFDRVRVIWGSDDMGFRGGTLISPADLRALVLPGHRRMAELAHSAGRPYILHSCGNIEAIMDDLIDDVGIDGKHSFEDAIQPVAEAKRRYGNRISLLGGMDVDFLCRSTEEAVRARTRETLQQCMPGGGYCLGTGNSVTNYIPLENYLAMLDEGRRFAV